MKHRLLPSPIKAIWIAALALCLATTAQADNVNIPTTAENPFDLTKGVVTSNDTHEHFTNNGVEWMIDGDYITYTLQNEKDVDNYYVTAYFDTGYNDVTVDLSLKAEKGDAVADTTFSIVNRGWYNANPYRVKTPAMKKGKYTLVFTFHRTPGSATANIKRIEFSAPESITIPTDNDHPFDLTKGVAISNSTKAHFTDYGVENMYDNEQLVYSLQCSEDLDVCNVYVGSDTNYGEVTLDFSLKSLKGDAVADTTWQIANKGWYKPNIYSTQFKKLKKGTYTLTLTFHQSNRTDWSACNISSISFLTPNGLKPGDNVDIANGEFDDGLEGWNRSGDGWNATLDIDGNKSSVSLFNYGTGELSQTIYNVPNGLYMLRLCAYDGANYMTGNPPQEQETYIFMNDQMKLIKTVFDESVSYRNIYRWRTGKSENSSFRHSADGRWVPTQGVDWNEAIAMTEHFYENCLIVPVTNGKVTFGWKKTGGNGNLRITYDHAVLTYLSDKTSISDTERAARETKQVTDDYKARLSALKQAISTELAAKRPHAPQAIAEANVLLTSDFSLLTSNNELIDEILHAEHLLQRLQLPFYDITVPDGSPSGLSDQLTALGIQATDTIALKLNGTPTKEDLATLKTLKNIMEVDLSATTLTAIPDNQFNNRMYLLTWVTLPNQLETIGNSAFHDCPELRDLQLPATLKSVSDYAFRYSYNFYHANIPEGLTVGNSAFRNSGIRKVTLPSSMKNVPSLLCADCYDLLDIQFNGQVNIESNAFWACNALKTLNIPEGIERLNSSCFGACDGLTSATLPSTLLTVTAPFHNCHNLKKVTCLTAAPPFHNEASIHGDLTSKGCTLYVPRQSVEEYQEANKWNEFDVEGIDTLPSTISVISNLTIDMTEELPADYKPDVNFNALYYYWGNNVTQVATYGKLTVNGPATLSAGRVKTLWNPFAARSHANRGDLWSTSYSSLINNGQMRADNVTIDLCLYTDCWDFFAFPFDVRVGDIRYQYDNVPLVIYGYDAQKRAEGKSRETWVPMTADSILHAGHGYIFQTTIPNGQQEERKKGYESYNWHFNHFYLDAMQNVNKPKFFRSDDVEVTLEKHNAEFAHDRSWNFIGNPYPCYYDIKYMETTAPIIIWYFTSSSSSQYRAYSPLDDDLVLYPGQAFFIQCPLDQDKLVFHKEGRQHSTTINYDTSRSLTRAAAPQHRQVFNLLLSGNSGEPGESGVLDRARFVINEAATLDYEPGCDANKFTPFDASTAQFYTVRDGIRYAIDERPLADGTVHLGLQLPTDGTYTISLAPAPAPVPAGSPAGISGSPASIPSSLAAPVPAGSPAGTVTLIDRETGTETGLTADSYTFQSEAGTFDNRFLVRLAGTTNAVQSVVAMPQQTQQLYDLQGRPVSSPLPGIYVRNNKKVIIK